MKTTRVAIGIPSGDMVHADFMLSLVNMVECTIRNAIHTCIINAKSSIIEKGRNDIVREALELKADYLLFLDSDMMFPSDLLLRLLWHKKDIVSANCSTRREPIKANTYDLKGNEVKISSSFGCLTEVEKTGTAILLVDRKVFIDMKYPWFAVHFDEYGMTASEDWYFCEKTRHKIYCDTSIKIGHIGTKTYSL